MTKTERQKLIQRQTQRQRTKTKSKTNTKTEGKVFEGKVLEEMRVSSVSSLCSGEGGKWEAARRSGKEAHVPDTSVLCPFLASLRGDGEETHRTTPPSCKMRSPS
jgi:hypothetical protein